MPETTLTACQALNGYHKQFGDTALKELTNQSLVSIAVPLGGDDALREAMTSAYGATFPAPGSTILSTDGSIRFLGLQSKECFALFESNGNEAVGIISNALGEAAYYTDQSDGWAMLLLSGPLALTSLERICTLDLAPTKFSLGSVARTAMEHLGVIVLHNDKDSYLLMSPRSSAPSFLHAVETSIKNVL